MKEEKPTIDFYLEADKEFKLISISVYKDTSMSPSYFIEAVRLFLEHLEKEGDKAFDYFEIIPEFKQ